MEHLDPGEVRNRKTGDPVLVRDYDRFGPLWCHAGKRPAPVTDRAQR
ncbi:MAG: hypothetical protein ACLPQS_08510 [Acidimicrobiales bacterium]